MALAYLILAKSDEHELGDFKNKCLSNVISFLNGIYLVNNHDNKSKTNMRVQLNKAIINNVDEIGVEEKKVVYILLFL